jgi:HEPN domain-containing protein
MANASLIDHKAWLAKAKNDLTAVRLCIRERCALDVAAYHCQQAAEKALKAFIVYHTQLVHRGHDLIFLLKKCTEIEFAFIQLEQIASSLTNYATYTRYPDDSFSIDLAEAKSAYKKALFVFDFVAKRLI